MAESKKFANVPSGAWWLLIITAILAGIVTYLLAPSAPPKPGDKPDTQQGVFPLPEPGSQWILLLKADKDGCPPPWVYFPPEHICIIRKELSPFFAETLSFGGRATNRNSFTNFREMDHDGNSYKLSWSSNNAPSGGCFYLTFESPIKATGYLPWRGKKFPVEFYKPLLG